MQRNNTYDIAKFVAITAVVLYHVENYIYSNGYLHSFIDTFFLSIFFFISGLLTKESKIYEDGWIRKQAIHLLIPFVFCFFLIGFVKWFIGGKPIFTLHSLGDAKSGYWFILSLFEFYGVMWILSGLLSKFQNKLTRISLLTLPFVVVSGLCIILPYEVAGYISLMSFRRYWLFFAYGFTLTNIFKNTSFFYSDKIGSLFIVLYLCLLTYYVIIIKTVDSNFSFCVWLLVNFIGVHFWLYAIKKVGTIISNMWVLNIGQNTLGIYLLHYYPLNVAIMHMGGVKMMNSNYLFYIYTPLIAVVLIVTAYYMTVLCKTNKWTAFLILGIRK